MINNRSTVLLILDFLIIVKLITLTSQIHTNKQIVFYRYKQIVKHHILHFTLKIQFNIFLTLTNGKNVIEANRWSISHTSHYVECERRSTGRIND